MGSWSGTYRDAQVAHASLRDRPKDCCRDVTFHHQTGLSQGRVEGLQREASESNNSNWRPHVYEHLRPVASRLGTSRA